MNALMTTTDNLHTHLHTLTPFLGLAQREAIRIGLRGEERELFRSKLEEYADRIRSMPKTYETNGQNALAYLHYFTSAFDWYVTEKDVFDDQLQAFGVAYLGRNPELGYINLVELVAAGAELDLYFTPTRLSEIERTRT